MSCDWGYRCKKCVVETETWFNHGEQILRDCVKVWPEVQKIRDTKSWFLEVHILGRGDMADLWNFIEEHHEHGIELVDEYGKTEPIEIERDISH